MKKKVQACIAVVMLLFSIVYVSPPAQVVAEEAVTVGRWMDSGNYTEGWYNKTTGCDIYGHAGTQDDPYEIKSAKDLAGLAYITNLEDEFESFDFQDKYITITAKEIDLSEHYWEGIGSYGYFYGTVEGNNVVIKNMFCGSSSEYQEYGNSGLFGVACGDISDIHVENAVIYSSNIKVGGFAAVCYAGVIKNCSVQGSINCSGDTNRIGGFVGYSENIENQENINQIVKCSANVSINANAITDARVGGFIGFYRNTDIKNCFAYSSVKAGASTFAGGFAGYTGDVSQTMNCYCRGNVAAGDTSNVAGFAGAYCGEAHIANCYSTGNVQCGDSSYLTGFLGFGYALSTICNIERCYYSKSAEQIVNGVSRTTDEKTGSVSSTIDTIRRLEPEYMQTEQFTTTLNEYVADNPEFVTWLSDSNINQGYPYLQGTEDLLSQNDGNTVNVELDSTESQADTTAHVFGTLVYPSIEPSEEPAADDMISVSLNWGSLEYIYQSGAYDYDAKQYTDGTWSPAVAGTSDKISIINHSACEIMASLSFSPNAELSKYDSLSGIFTFLNIADPITAPFKISAKQGTVDTCQDAFLGIKGIPAGNQSTESSECIGDIGITISRVA